MIARNILTFLFLSSSIFAAETEFKNLEEKASYLIGRHIGDSLLQDEVEVEVEPLLLGLREALSKIESRFSDEATEKILSENYDRLEKKQIEKIKAFAQERLKEVEMFLAKNGKREGVTITDSGLQYEVLSASEGAKPQETDYAIAHLHGTLTNGIVFDSSVERGVPEDFRLDQMISGLGEVLQLMSVGSKWKVYIPPAIGFGEEGSGELIGPNEILVYEVELLSIRDSKKKDSAPAEN